MTAHRLGFVVNPIAGMGGRVGLKGTDAIVDRARALGAEPTAAGRAAEMLAELRARLRIEGEAIEVCWLTAAGAMGEECLAAVGLGANGSAVSVTHRPGRETTAEDTRMAVASFVEAGAELIVFCGGDGTARDVTAVTGLATPILGVPAGVKMYSGVFGMTPRHTARILLAHLRGELELADAEVLDIDEERYRAGELAVELHALARTPFEPSLSQVSKALISATGEDEVRRDIADDVVERMAAEPDTLFLLGPGGTIGAIGRRLGVDKTLLGIDAFRDGRRIGVDLAERDLLQLLDDHRQVVLVLSPTGAQGFVLGRGNQPLSPQVVRRIGPANLVVVGSPAKLARTPILRFDTGCPDLDRELTGDGYRPVVTGHHLSRMVKVAGDGSRDRAERATEEES